MAALATIISAAGRSADSPLDFAPRVRETQVFIATSVKKGAESLFIDGRTIPAKTDLVADIAVIGAGAAGITLAKALTGSGFKVAILESGDYDFTQSAQDLAAGDLGAQNYAAPDVVRLRQFGGTTGHWGGWCREFDALDFEARDGVPYSGWPIAKDELTAYYAKAQEILQLGPRRYDDVLAVASEAKATMPIPAGGAVEPVLFQMSAPVRMGETYRGEVGAMADGTVYLNTTVTDIRVGDGAKSVTGLILSRDGGSPLALTARHVVIACGGISNAQILLNARHQAAAGLGNAAGQVGRYFTDHPILEGFAALLSLGPEAGGPFASDFSAVGPQRFRLAFAPAVAHRREAKRLSALITIEPPGPTFDAETGGFKDWSDRYYGGHDAIAAIARLYAGNAPPRLHAVNAGIEVRPNPESRITLTDKQDRFGQQRVKVDWKLADADIDDYLATLTDLAAAFARAGAAVLRIRPDARTRFSAETFWGSHNLCATRMGADPKTSVCDRDCRVHGMANLWIAGSSVFSTSGVANPTLTLVALAFRLADRLKREMAA